MGLVSSPDTLYMILQGLRRMPWSVMWLDRVALDQPHWQEFVKALGRANLPWNSHAQTRFGVVDCRAIGQIFRPPGRKNIATTSA